MVSISTASAGRLDAGSGPPDRSRQSEPAEKSAFPASSEASQVQSQSTTIPFAEQPSGGPSAAPEMAADPVQRSEKIDQRNDTRSDNTPDRRDLNEQVAQERSIRDSKQDQLRAEEATQRRIEADSQQQRARIESQGLAAKDAPQVTSSSAELEHAAGQETKDAASVASDAVYKEASEENRAAAFAQSGQASAQSQEPPVRVDNASDSSLRAGIEPGLSSATRSNEETLISRSSSEFGSAETPSSPETREGQTPSSTNIERFTQATEGELLGTNLSVQA